MPAASSSSGFGGGRRMMGLGRQCDDDVKIVVFEIVKGPRLVTRNGKTDLVEHDIHERIRLS